MSNEAQALAGAPQDAGDSEYEAFLGVLSSSARGRAFLAEHARRARHADNEMLLAALARIEVMLAEERAEAPASPPPATQPAPPATALAAVAAQAIAAAGDAVPEVKVIKAGTMPPPAPFAGDDFAADDAVIAAPVRETPAVPAKVVAEAVATEHAAVAAADAQVDDALATLLALSEEERLALFS